MPNELIEFWKQCKLDKPPFFHPKDETTLLQGNGKFLETNFKNFDAYIKGSRFGENENRRLHLSLRPVPYLGNLAQAKIFILLLNPGLAYADYWAESNSKAFCQRLENNLQQSFDGIDFPFFKLDPQFCWCSGFMWWESKLHEVIRRIAKEQFDNQYIDAMRDLSTKLACLELVPYHSSSFGAHSLIKNLPSVKMVKKFVTDSLIPQAEDAKLTLIVTRQAKEWRIPNSMEKTKNIVVYKGGHTRGASLSPNSLGGKAILRHYGIEDK
jgi:hypothetical protein